MNKEEWKGIKGLERCYMISSLGRIKSKSRVSAYGRKLSSRILKADGKGSVKLWGDDGEPIKKVASTLVIEHFLKEPVNRDEYVLTFLDNDTTNISASNRAFIKKSGRKSISSHEIELILNYINEGEPDIEVIKAELGELILRSNGEYFKES